MHSSNPHDPIPPRVLIVDDDRDMCEVLRLTLEAREYVVSTQTSPSGALERVAAEDFEVVLTDLQMSEMNGVALCESILAIQPDMPVIVVTGHGSMSSAVAALRAGAYDFVTKPVEAEILAHSVGRAVEHRLLRSEVKRLRAPSEGANAFIRDTPAMQRLHQLIARVAESDVSVLIRGETGTGKELIARTIHRASARSRRPFVAINCAAIPPALLESELFGHARGAFTDAKGARTGLFVEANGGTLLLDEIAELPLAMQPKLLRALQERTARPVGSNHEVPFDVRIIGATHRDLEHEVLEKRFREDLYYRLNVISVEVPPLRERPGEILPLVQHFLAKFAGVKAALALTESAAERLVAYGWPGNVRELENCVERAVALAQFDHLTIADLPAAIRRQPPHPYVLSDGEPTQLLTLDELERRHIDAVLSEVGGNKSRAALVLGLDRRTLYRRLAAK